jgi:kumamolisin
MTGMAEPRRIALPGSERTPLAGARAIGRSDAAERLEVSLHLPPRSPLPAATHDPGAVLSRAEFARRHGANPRDLRLVRDFAARYGLQVLTAHPGRRTVVLGGSVADFSAAFGVELRRYRRAGATYRGRTGALHLPADLAAVVEGVFGLDDRPQAKPHFRRRSATSRARGPHASGFTPRQIADLYAFPRHLDGRGVTVALLELGGGYRPADLRAAFAAMGTRPPRVVDVSVDGGSNSPIGDPDSDDSEVQLDIEVLGAVAPGVRIAVYWAPNTERGFLDAVSTAVHDDRRRPAVLSISWGAAEATWTRQAIRAVDGVLQAAAAVGVTVLAASGDQGSQDGMHDGRAHVDFPGSSPHVLACGGTRLHLHRDGVLASEEAWNDGPRHGATGGGVSEVFELPAWQQAADPPPSVNPEHRRGRGVSDVAGAADPDTGYAISVDGVATVLGGTSAVGPLWAALVAMAVQAQGRPLGFLNPLVYDRVLCAGAMRDVRAGSNGAYAARTGWDACTGLGTPEGGRVLEALRGDVGLNPTRSET